MVKSSVNFFIIITLFCFLTPIKLNAQRSYNEKNIVVALREMGHKILLASNDSTSKVLAIEKNKERYKIQFESDFYFLPDSLAKIINQVSNDYKLASNYIVEVEKCDSNTIIYSYKHTLTSGVNELACRLRAQQLDCYKIYISYNKPEEILKESITENVEKKSNYLNEFLIGLFIFSVILFLYFYKSPPKKINNNAITIGCYEFDNVKMTLLNNNELTELSSKETDLLYLLYTNKNTVVERDLILNQVWGDEGDYVGRTLDVFVSKLRKKLTADSNIKIVNSRGVGYKLID